MSTTFVVKQVQNERTGALENAVVKETTVNGVTESEQWCTIDELDRLFEACSRRWSVNGWDLEKLMTCVNECDFE